MEVNNKMCSSCIFGSNSPISPERLEDYKKKWRRLDTQQECHHSTVEETGVVCRGYFEAALRGEVHTGQLMRIAERLDFVRFVEVSEKHERGE